MPAEIKQDSFDDLIRRTSVTRTCRRTASIRTPTAGREYRDVPLGDARLDRRRPLLAAMGEPESEDPQYLQGARRQAVRARSQKMMPTLRRRRPDYFGADAAVDRAEGAGRLHLRNRRGRHVLGVLDAAWDNGRYAWNANSRWRALEEATTTAASRACRRRPARRSIIRCARGAVGRRLSRDRAAHEDVGQGALSADYMAEIPAPACAHRRRRPTSSACCARTCPSSPTRSTSHAAAGKLNDVLSRTSGLTGTLANLAGGVGAAFEDLRPMRSPPSGCRARP